MSTSPDGADRRSSANPSLPEILCTRCGLCCDGSLLADVELSGQDEASGLEILGLEVEEDDGDAPGLLLLPCRALRGTLCSIYPHRPDCCRTFECRLLQEVGRGRVEVERAKEIIEDARRRIARIEELIAAVSNRVGRLPLKERCLEALARSERRAGDPRIQQMRDELEAAMASFEALVQRVFLG